MQYQQEPPAPAERKGGPLAALLSARGGAKPVAFAAKAGETVELAIGTPLKGYVEATVVKGAVQMNLRLADAAGLDVDAQWIMMGQNSNPQVEVLDADGKRVHSGKFEYGGGGTCSHTWSVPNGVKGKFTIVPKLGTGPFEVNLETKEIVIR